MGIERTVRFSLLLLFSFLLVGCETLECGQYKPFVEDPGVRGKLQAWADNGVFSRSFQREELELYGLVSPGRFVLRPEVAGVPRPENLETKEIRIIGDRSAPKGVFIGSGNYKGLVIAKDDLDAVLRESSVLADEVVARQERTAIICRPYR